MKEEFSFASVNNRLSFLKVVLKKSFIPIVLITILGGATGYFFKPNGTYVSKGLLSNGVIIENPYLRDNFSVKSSDISISFEEVKTLFYSKSLLKNTLLNQCEVNGRKDILANHLLEYSDLGKGKIDSKNLNEKTLNQLIDKVSNNLDIYEKRGNFTVVEFSHKNQEIASITAQVVIDNGINFLKSDYLPNYQASINNINSELNSVKNNLEALTNKTDLNYLESLEQKKLENQFFQLENQLAFFKTKKLTEELPVKLIDSPDKLASYQTYPTWLIVSLYTAFSFIFALSFFVVFFMFQNNYIEMKASM